MKRKPEEPTPMRMFAVALNRVVLHTAFTRVEAERERDIHNPAADVVEFIEVPRTPERATPWGDGQFDTVQLAPGVTAALRVTRAGEVEMLCPALSGPITTGACMLGLGLLEATRRAAEVRTRIAEREWRRQQRKAKSK